MDKEIVLKRVSSKFAEKINVYNTDNDRVHYNPIKAGEIQAECHMCNITDIIPATEHNNYYLTNIGLYRIKEG